MFRTEGKIIIITVAAVVLIWTTDALIDAFFLHQSSFLEVFILNVSPHEAFTRAFYAAVFIFLGFLFLRTHARRKQRDEEHRKQSAAIEASMDGIAISDQEGVYVYVNQAYAVFSGYESPREIIGRPYGLFYDETAVERMERSIAPVLQKSGRWRGELIAKRKNGSTYFQEASLTMLEDGGRVCIVRDITWRKRNEERLRRSEQFLNMIFDSIRDPFSILDKDFTIIRVNEAYAQLKNKPVQELIGRKCFEALQDRDSVCEGCVVEKSFHSADPCAKDKHVTLHNGADAWVEIYTYPILDEEGRVSHVIEYTLDITDRKKSEEEKRRLIEKLEHLSRTDGLTGLLNRRALTESLSYEIDRAGRYDAELSILLCDIDNFKKINDRYGHDAGDRALQMISATLRTLLRKTDIAGRYGGDEFMLVLPETALQGAESLAEKLRSAMENTESLFQDSTPVRLTMSIGVSSLDEGGKSMDSLIKRADDAMYASKQAARKKPPSSRS